MTSGAHVSSGEHRALGSVGDSGVTTRTRREELLVRGVWEPPLIRFIAVGGGIVSAALITEGRALEDWLQAEREIDAET